MPESDYIVDGAQSELAEAMRIIRSNLSVSLASTHPIVVVTSARADEGKTLVCSNLAASFAIGGWKVIAVDLDFRRPSLHEAYRIGNEPGLSDVVQEQIPLTDALQYVEFERTGRETGMYVLTTGSPVAQPAELIGSRRMTRVLEALSEQADLVLIDAPPVLPVADTLIAARSATGALLVIEYGETPVPVAQKAKDALIRNQTRLFGVVLNKVPTRDLGSGYGYGVRDERASSSAGR